MNGTKFEIRKREGEDGTVYEVFVEGGKVLSLLEQSAYNLRDALDAALDFYGIDQS